jgi:hypothetical protein
VDRVCLRIYVLNIQYALILTETEFRMLLRVPVALRYRQLQNEVAQLKRKLLITKYSFTCWRNYNAETQNA